MKALIPILAALTLVAPLCAFAQAGAGGRGGDAIVCFDRNIKDVSGKPDYVTKDKITGEDKITEDGRKGAISAVTREQWQIEHRPTYSTFLKDLNSRTYEEAVDTIIGRFDAFPYFSDKLREYNEELKSFSGPEASRLTSVEDIKDSSVNFTVPENCFIVQGVIRQIDVFRSNETATEQLLKVSSHAAMMQVHELIYMYGTTQFQHKDSGMTELLLMAVTGSDPTTEEIGRKLNKYEFPIAMFQKDGREAFFTVDEISNRADKEVTRYLSRLDTLSARIASGPTECPDNEYYESYHRESLSEPAHFLPNNYLIWVSSLLPKKHVASSNLLVAMAKEILAEMKLEISKFEYSSGTKCSYKGSPVTPEQKARIRAKLDDFTRGLRDDK